MRRQFFVRAAGAAIAVSCLSTTAPAAPVRLTSDALAQPPSFLNPRLSPDGTKMLATLNVKGETVLGIIGLDGQSVKTIGIADDQNLRDYWWAGDGKVVFSVGSRIEWYGRGERYVTRAFAYDLAKGKAVPLGPKVQSPIGDDILWTDKDGKSVLMTSQPDQFTYPSVFRVSLDDGKPKLEQGPYDYGWDWIADTSGEVRFGIGYRENSWFSYYRKPGSSGPAGQPPHPYTDEAALGFGYIVRPGSDEGFAFFPSENRRYALYRYNFATQKRGEKLFEHATNDLSGAMIDVKSGEPLGVYFTSDRHRVTWLDTNMKIVQEKLDGNFDGKVVSIVSHDRDRKRFVVLVDSTDDPGTYYLYEPATNKLSRLGKIAASVDPAGLSTTRYIRYKARDGLEIPAYLTLPVGRDAKNLPLIIMPHGGPYGVRDTLDYDNEVQFLANRGYAVLQPNYRGSDGYGGAFADKGRGQWGRAMQDDIDDGMDYLAKAGTIDPKRVCLVGASYGGYVAMWGATRNPERYRCAVSFAGVSDLAKQVDYSGDFLTGTRWRKDWSDRVKGDRKFDLSSISPLARASELKVPMMLVHGGKDTTVPPKQTELYDKALTAAGKVHETYLYPTERHGFTDPKNEKDYLDKLEAFLTKYNPAQ
jgi:dipeptidyl aminopeptidase/acylaminoacyl peptidase